MEYSGQNSHGPTLSNITLDSANALYDSAQGHALCNQILVNYLLYESHNYILDGICPIMDGYDLLAITPTGSGKRSFQRILQ